MEEGKWVEKEDKLFVKHYTLETLLYKHNNFISLRCDVGNFFSSQLRSLESCLLLNFDLGKSCIPLNCNHGKVVFL